MEATIQLTDLTNQRTFEKIYKDYYRPLCAFAYDYVADHDIAEETVQEMFSTVWSKAGQIEIRTNVKSYLYGAVRNSCLNFLKHEKIKRKHEAYELQKSELEEIDFLELDELQAEIEQALNKLPEKCRRIFEMSRYEDKKYSEIAEELDISIKTVETQMSCALKVMRESLGKYLPLILWIIYLLKKNL